MNPCSAQSRISPKKINNNNQHYHGFADTLSVARILLPESLILGDIIVVFLSKHFFKNEAADVARLFALCFVSDENCDKARNCMVRLCRIN